MILRNHIKQRNDTLPSGATLQDVVDLMAAEHISYVVLLENEIPAGVLTERDILFLYHDHADFDKAAWEYAVKPVITTDVGRTVAYALTLMVDYNIRRMVTVDDTGRYAGTLLQEELIFAIESEAYLSPLKVADMLQEINRAVALGADASLQEALDKMAETSPGSVLIFEQGKPLGILTESDVIHLARRHVETEQPLSHYMHSPVITVDEEALLYDVVSIFRQRQIRHAVVHALRSDDYFVLTSSDVMHNLKGNYSAFLESRLYDNKQMIDKLDEAVIEVALIDNEQIVHWSNEKAKTLFSAANGRPIIGIVPERVWSDVLDQLGQEASVSGISVSLQEREFYVSLQRSEVLGTPLIKMLFTDVTELARLNRKLSSKVEETFEQGAVGIAHVSLEYQIIKANRKLTGMLGYAEGSLYGRSIVELTPKEHLDETLAHYRELLKGGPGASFSCDKKCIRRDGTHIWVNATTSISYDINGDPAYYICFIKDIDETMSLRKEQKMAMDALRLERERAEQYLDVAGVMMVALDAQGKVQLINPKGCEILGYEKEEVLGKEWFANFLPENVQERVHTVFEGLMAGTVSLQEYFENAVLTKNGEERLIAWHNGLLHDDEGEIIGTLSSGEDITERNMAEERIRESEERFRGLTESTSDWIWEIDENGLYTYASPKIRELLGYDPEEVVGRSPFDLMPPDEAARVGAEFGKIAQTQQAFSGLENINLHKEGRQVVLETSGVPFFGADGGFRGYRGVDRDITERKVAEKKLKQSAAVFENTDEGVMITDGENRIVAVNEAFTEITGYTEEEIIGSKPSVIQSGKHDRNFYQQMWESIRKTDGWHGEVWNRKKDGTLYPEWLNISTIRDDKGDIANYIGVFSDISKIKESEEQLYFLAHHDPLTELPNRLLLHARLGHALQRARREGSKLALLFLDLDNFKNINDAYGHSIGDGVLRKVAERLQASIREEDTLCRVGGDEFVVLLEDADAITDVDTVCGKLIGAFEVPIEVQKHRFALSGSIGIALYPNDGESIDQLLKNADAAMYKAKEAGGSTCRYYTEDITAALFEKMVMESELRRALEADEFTLFYQPQFDLETGSMVGAEALVRWNHPGMGLIPPDRFIPHAEATRLIVPLGRQVLEKACSQVKAWHAEGLFTGRIAVNVSGVQFKHGDIVKTVEEILVETALDPKLLELEVTETFIMENPKEHVIVFKALKRLGIELAIDDFGTGYSSLSYLKQLPVDKLKIDKSFVNGLPEGKDDRAIANAVIALAKSMEMKVLAEGIETKEQAEYLAKQGCREGQGYWYGRPLPEEDFHRWMVDRQ